MIKNCLLLFVVLSAITVSLQAYAQAPSIIEIITYGDSVTAGLINTTNDGESANCAPGVPLGLSFSGSGSLRCLGNGLEGVGGYQPELKSSLQELGNEVLIYNYGFSGINTLQMRTLDSGYFTEQFNSSYVLLMGGANDAFQDVSASTVQNNLQDIVNTICRFEMIPVLSAVTKVQEQLDRVQQYNVEILEITTASSIDCASRDIDVIHVDQFNALSNSGGDFTDGTHLSASGNTKMAQTWFDALALPVSGGLGSFLPAIFLLLIGD